MGTHELPDLQLGMKAGIQFCSNPRPSVPGSDGRNLDQPAEVDSSPPINSTTVQQINSASEQSPPDLVPAEQSRTRSVWDVCRRVGRLLLRPLRPLVLPILHRFEWRVRTALVKVGLVDSVSRIENSLVRVERAHARIESANIRLESASARIEGAHAKIEGTHARYDEQFRQLIKHGKVQEVQLQQLLSIVLHDRERSRAEFETLRAASDGLHDTLSEIWKDVSSRTDLLLTRAVIPCSDALLVRTPSGWLMAPSSDPKLVGALYESRGALEPGTTLVIERLLGPGDLVLEVGAHIGLTSLLAARRIGDRGRVLAIEPVPELASLLRRSVSLNDLDGRIVVFQCAAGENKARHELNIAPVRGHSSLLPLDLVSERADVDVQRLDDLVAPGTAVALAKIDVEGFEMPAWRGMQRIVAESPGLSVVIAFEPSYLARFGMSAPDWLAELTAPGFTAYEIDEATGVCRKLRTDGSEQLASMNLLLLRRPPDQFAEVGFA